MALEGTDLLAVYRPSDLKNYSTTVADIVARVPQPGAPTLTSVLQTNNTSDNIAIKIKDNNNNEVCVLGSNSSTPNSFTLIGILPTACTASVCNGI